jgi:hypothetical protein
MKPEQLYQHLKSVAEKLGVKVIEQNLSGTAAGIRIRSGLCRIKGETRFIMDKRLPIREKNELLASCLSQFALEDIYIMPALRDIIRPAAQFVPIPSGYDDSNSNGSAL